jgi:hypothetical protein
MVKYQANIIVQWDSMEYEEFRGIGACWKLARENAIEQANQKAIAQVKGFRVLSDKEWRALPKPISKAHLHWTQLKERA